MDSSIWDEPDTVCKVFLTMLALKDSDHIVRLNAYQLGQRSRKSEVEVLEALRVLSSPDTKRVEPQDFEGRRIQAVEEGWLVLNGEKYRERVRIEMLRAKNRRAQAKHREKMRQLNHHGTPTTGEAAALRAMARGDHSTSDQLAGERTP